MTRYILVLALAFGAFAARADNAPSAPPVPSAEPAAEPFVLRILPGEMLSDQLIRQAPSDYQLVWRSKQNLAVAAAATITGATYEDALLTALNALWHTDMPLYVDTYTNNVFVVQDY